MRRGKKTKRAGERAQITGRLHKERGQSSRTSRRGESTCQANRDLAEMLKPRKEKKNKDAIRTGQSGKTKDSLAGIKMKEG